MRASCRIAAATLVLCVAVAGCRSPLGRQYEYEEQLYLSMDGAATVIIDASIASLVALRGMPLDPSYRAVVDRDEIRRLYASAGCSDVRVGQPWVRQGRRFVQVRVSTPDVADLSACGPLAWSTYGFASEGRSEESYVRYDQTVRASSGRVPDDVNWDGSELVAFKVHVPSRIVYHNVKRLEDGANGRPGRGNILTWEQRLTDRLAGTPVEMEIRMEAESILYRTLWLFGGAFAGAVVLLLAMIWITVRRARARASAAS